MREQEEPLAVILLDDVDSYFKQLVETYQHQLYRWMCRQTGSTQDAEDIGYPGGGVVDCDPSVLTRCAIAM